MKAEIEPIRFDKLNLPALHGLAVAAAETEGKAARPQGATPTVIAHARRVAQRIAAERHSLPACSETGDLLAMVFTVLHYTGE